MTTKPGITRNRLLAGALILIVASALMSLGNVDMGSYFAGVAIGIAVVAGIYFLLSRRPRS
jgi:hypothetical protein